MDQWFSKYGIKLKEYHAVECIEDKIENSQKYLREGKEDQAYHCLAEAKMMIDDFFQVKGMSPASFMKQA